MAGVANNRFKVCDVNGEFVQFYTALTNFINTNYAQGVTMELTAPGKSPGSPVQAFTLIPSGGNIVAGTAQPAPAAPTITVDTSAC